MCGLCCAGYWLACFSRVSVVVASSRDIPSDQRFTFIGMILLLDVPSFAFPGYRYHPSWKRVTSHV